MPACDPTRPRISTRSAVFFAPNSGIIVISPHACVMLDMIVASVVASLIKQQYPFGLVRATQRHTHVGRSALWWALCVAGLPRKYGGLDTTMSNVRFVRHVVISVLISSSAWPFSSAFCSHAVNICCDVSNPVIVKSGLWASMHNDTPPVPMPTSRTVFALAVGANAASHTASDVGL